MPITYRPAQPKGKCYEGHMPWRPPWLYPEGTEFTNRRGYVWRVVYGGAADDYGRFWLLEGKNR